MNAHEMGYGIEPWDYQRESEMENETEMGSGTCHFLLYHHCYHYMVNETDCSVLFCHSLPELHQVTGPWSEIESVTGNKIVHDSCSCPDHDCENGPWTVSGLWNENAPWNGNGHGSWSVNDDHENSSWIYASDGVILIAIDYNNITTKVLSKYTCTPSMTNLFLRAR